MPQGYYTIEQWKPPQWVAVAVLPFGMSQTAAERTLERLGRAGFYRLVHTQRVIWCEREGAGLRLRKAHASSPQNLDKMRKLFERTRGEYPVEEVKAARREAKRNGGAAKREGGRK